MKDLNDLSAVSLLTIADALTHYALAQASDDERVPRVIRALQELDYNETAGVLRRIVTSRDEHLVKAWAFGHSSDTPAIRARINEQRARREAMRRA